MFIFIYFYLGFPSRTFTIHRTAGKGRYYLFNYSLPLPPTSQALRQWVITANSSPLPMGRSRTQTGNLWFPWASR